MELKCIVVGRSDHSTLVDGKVVRTVNLRLEIEKNDAGVRAVIDVHHAPESRLNLGDRVVVTLAAVPGGDV